MLEPDSVEHHRVRRDDAPLKTRCRTAVDAMGTGRLRLHEKIVRKLARCNQLSVVNVTKASSRIVSRLDRVCSQADKNALRQEASQRFQRKR